MCYWLVFEVCACFPVLTHGFVCWTDNSLGSEGGSSIAKALQTNTTLTTLDLSGNSSIVWILYSRELLCCYVVFVLYFECSMCRWLVFEVCVCFPVLTHGFVCWTDNMLGSEGGSCIAKALQTNTTLTTLNLYGNSLIVDALFSRVVVLLRCFCALF